MIASSGKDKTLRLYKMKVRVKSVTVNQEMEGRCKRNAPKRLDSLAAP